jgi:hypothetical protein
LDRAILARTVAAIRSEAVVNRTDALTMSEVDAEVATVRARRRSA